MPHVAHIHMVFSPLDMVRTPSASNFTTRVPWMFSNECKAARDVTRAKSTLQDWLFGNRLRNLIP